MIFTNVTKKQLTMSYKSSYCSRGGLAASRGRFSGGKADQMEVSHRKNKGKNVLGLCDLCYFVVL